MAHIFIYELRVRRLVHGRFAFKQLKSVEQPLVQFRTRLGVQTRLRVREQIQNQILFFDPIDADLGSQ